MKFRMKIKSASNKIAKIFYLSIGLLLLTAGIVGLILPVIPGFIFLIIAVFFIAKSSRRMNNLFQKSKYYKMYFSDAKE